MKTVTLPIQGLDFATCVRAIEKRLAALGAVTSAEASYASRTVTVTYDERRVSEDTRRDVVRDCGFACGAPL
jgi:copper chaperone CopZ